MAVLIKTTIIYDMIVWISLILIMMLYIIFAVHKNNHVHVQCINSLYLFRNCAYTEAGFSCLLPNLTSFSRNMQFPCTIGYYVAYFYYLGA